MKSKVRYGDIETKTARTMAIDIHVIMFALIFLISTSSVASADNWYSTNWSYVRPIIVNTSSNLTDYQIAINITNATNMNSTFQDIRFTATDNATLLPYWIESSVASSWAYVWIKGNFTTLNGVQMYMWYGNPSATSQSNLSQTYTFDDEFNGASLGSKWLWNTISGSYLVDNGNLSITTGGNSKVTAQIPAITSNFGYVLATKVFTPPSQNINWDYLLLENNTDTFRYEILSCRNGWCSVHEKAVDAAFTQVGSSPWSKTWLVTETINMTTGTISLVNENNPNGDNYTSIDTLLSSDFANGVNITLGGRPASGSGTMYWDYVRVRKYVNLEPVYSVAAEQQRMNTAPTVVLSSPADNSRSTSRTINHQFTPSDDSGFSNCSVWNNATGVWALNQTNTSAILDSSVNTISITYPTDGNYLWGVQCYDNGNPSLSNFSITNRTVKIDTVSPALNSYIPSLGAVGIDVNTTITLVFSEDMNQSTFSGVTLKDSNNVNVPLTLQSYNSTTYTAMFWHSTLLDSNKAYIVNMTGLTDIAGNTLTSRTWSFTTATAYSINLSKSGVNGWNLISLPIVPTNTAPASVLSNVISDIVNVWAYNGVTGNWSMYAPNNPSSDLTEMTAGQGYWINYNNSVSKAITGSGNLIIEGDTTPPQRTLVSGWNLIGYYLRGNTNTIASKCALFTLTPDITDETAKWWSTVFGYDNQNKQLTQIGYTGDMTPGQGYWVFMTSKLSTYVYGPGLSSSECA